MFDNIGSKIKMLAGFITRAGIILSIAAGIGIMTTTDPVIGILVGLFGSIFFWIVSFFCYGFGELIDVSTENKNATQELLAFLKGKDGEAFAENTAEKTTDTADDAAPQTASSAPDSDQSR